MKAGQLLRDAANLVDGDRNRTHGDKIENHRRIADYWNVFLSHRPDKPLTPADVATLMVLLKVSRSQYGAHNVDDFVDMAGYAGVAGECAESSRLTVVPTLHDRVMKAIGD